MASVTFKEIVARHTVVEAFAQDSIGKSVPPYDGEVAHADRALLIEMVKALQHVAKPHPGTLELSPLVLYFPNDDARAGFEKAVKEAIPGMRSVNLP